MASNRWENISFYSYFQQSSNRKQSILERLKLRILSDKTLFPLKFSVNSFKILDNFYIHQFHPILVVNFKIFLQLAFDNHVFAIQTNSSCMFLHTSSLQVEQLGSKYFNSI